MMGASQIEKEFLEKIASHQAIIHKICFIYSNGNEERKDLSQEIFLQLWKSYPAFRGEASFSTWMYRVALNTAISQVKKSSIIREQRGLYESDLVVDELNSYSEEVQILYRAIATLKKVEKAIILLWLEDKTYEEIASALGISVKNVSVRLVRIKSRLGEIIQKIQ